MGQTTPLNVLRPHRAQQSTQQPLQALKVKRGQGAVEATPNAHLSPTAPCTPTRRLEVPKATQQDIERTLGLRKWSLLGLRFGPKNKITDVQLLTDPSGLAFGAFARINGVRVALDGALYARAAQRQVNLVAPAATVHPATPPRAVVPLAQAISLSTLATVRSSESSLSRQPSTPATSVYSETAAPLTQADTARARWSLYCDLAAEKTFFATDTEVAALALSLGRDIRVVAKWPGKQGTTLTVSDFAGDAGHKAGQPTSATRGEPLTVVLHKLHYQPLVGDASAMPHLSANYLHGALSAQDVSAVEAQLTALTQAVPGDGACFFHSIARLTGSDADSLRQQAVAFMRAHGESLKIPSASVEGFEQTLSEGYMPHPSQKAYKTIMERFPDRA